MRSLFELLSIALGVHITGAVLWFVFYMTHMLINPRERAKFQYLVEYGSSKKFPPSITSVILILAALGNFLLKWEVSFYNTVMKSYKNFLPKRK